MWMQLVHAIPFIIIIIATTAFDIMLLVPIFEHVFNYIRYSGLRLGKLREISQMRFFLLPLLSDLWNFNSNSIKRRVQTYVCVLLSIIMCTVLPNFVVQDIARD